MRDIDRRIAILDIEGRAGENIEAVPILRWQLIRFPRRVQPVRHIISRKRRHREMQERAMMEQDIRREVIEYEFLLNMLALHDVFGFGLERCMKLYRRTLEHNIALIESKCKTPVDMLVETVNDEFKCDIRKVMTAINKDVEEKE